MKGCSRLHRNQTTIQNWLSRRETCDWHQNFFGRNGNAKVFACQPDRWGWPFDCTRGISAYDHPSTHAPHGQRMKVLAYS
jgi:hypothetical protein